MAIPRKEEREILRTEYVEYLFDILKEKGEDVLRVKSNEIAFPVVGCEGNEDFIVVTVKVPTGANKGLEPYDGYEMAEDYERKQNEAKEKKRKREEEKKKKMEKDKAIREKKKEIAEKGAE